MFTKWGTYVVFIVSIKETDCWDFLLFRTGFRGKNIAGVLTTARLKTSRRVVACDIFSQKSILIIIDLRRNCKHGNADTNNFDEINFAESLASLPTF